MKDFDFIDISEEDSKSSTPIEEIETLDFELDNKVSNEIDEMLDFIELQAKPKEEISMLESVIDNAKVETSIEIKANEEKIEEYKTEVKDDNLKLAKRHRILKRAMLYVIIFMLFGFEFFIEKAGNVLNDIRVYAIDASPIRIVKNDKIGYIDTSGDNIVNPKYLYGEDFIDGYALVKGSNNFPMIIDKGGKIVVETGKYFSIYRSNEDFIASKLTKDGLKFGVLFSNLKEKIDFKYDYISFNNGLYTFTKENTVGVFNKEGKEIYSYQLSDEDDKKISVNLSNVKEKYTPYASIKVNKTSVIINTIDGTIITKPTLNEIVVNDNNVFYEKLKNNVNRYFYIKDNKVILESETYNSVSVFSIESGIIKCINPNYTTEYISALTGEQIKKNISNDVYYNDDLFIYKEYNYKKYKNVFNIVKNGKIINTLDNIKAIYKPYKNSFAIVEYEDGKYGYINNEGKFLNDIHYDKLEEFDTYKNAIIFLDGKYGVINNKGDYILKPKYSNIISAGAKYKKNNDFENNVFYAASLDSKYILFDSKGKKYNSEKYTEVVFDELYPIVKVKSNEGTKILLPKKQSEIELESFEKKYKAFDNYILIDNKYYSYNGIEIYEINK